MIAGIPDVEQALQIIQQKNIFVGLKERFDESIFLLKTLIENSLNINYRRVNVARDKTIAKNLLESEDTRHMLVEANQADLELYNYVSKELYPSFQLEYGLSLEVNVKNYQQTRENNFDERNIALSRMKQYMLYKSLLHLFRRGIKVV